MEVRLNIENVDLVYRWLGLTNIAERYQHLFDSLTVENSVIAEKFVVQLKTLRASGHSLQKYVEKIECYADALLVIATVTQLPKDIYMRNLSVSLFRDSKSLEHLEPYIVEILQMTNDVQQSWDDFFAIKRRFEKPELYLRKRECGSPNKRAIYRFEKT